MSQISEYLKIITILFIRKCSIIIVYTMSTTCSQFVIGTTNYTTLLKCRQYTEVILSAKCRITKIHAVTMHQTSWFCTIHFIVILFSPFEIRENCIPFWEHLSRFTLLMSLARIQMWAIFWTVGNNINTSAGKGEAGETHCHKML